MKKDIPDWKLILDLLLDTKPHHILDIMLLKGDNCKNWAVRSRISDLKHKGYIIESKIAPDGQAIYQLIQNTPKLVKIVLDRIKHTKPPNRDLKPGNREIDTTGEVVEQLEML